MNIGAYTCYNHIRNDDIMFNNKSFEGSYDYEFQNYHELKKLLNRNEIMIESIKNIDDLYKYDCYLVLDTWENDTYEKEILKSKKKKIKIVTEPPSLKSHYWNKDHLNKYDLVFTFYDPHVDNIKFFKYIDAWLPFEPKNNINFDQKKFAIMINSNKKSNHNNELYSERIKIIKFYESFEEELFDLYGRNWDRYVFPMNNALSILNSKKFNFLFKTNTRKSWRGTVSKKEKILNLYKFNYCLENYFELNGWITEKIFDAFANNNVPIYSGSKDIDKFIPPNTYINYYDFKNIKELNKYLKNVTEKEYIDYLDNFKKFRNSEKFRIFEKDSFAKIFIKALGFVK